MAYLAKNSLILDIYQAGIELSPALVHFIRLDLSFKNYIDKGLIDEDTNSFIDLLCVPKPLSVQPLLQRWAKATTSSPKSLWQSVLPLTARWTILWRLCRSNKTVHDVLKQKGFSEKYELY